MPANSGTDTGRNLIRRNLHQMIPEPAVFPGGNNDIRIWQKQPVRTDYLQQPGFREFYCGFNCYNKISRACLSEAEMEREMEQIAETGLKEILLLTGESRVKSNVDYIGKACSVARKHFRVIGLEIYPVSADEYRFLHECGADYVTVFQETYNKER